MNSVRLIDTSKLGAFNQSPVKGAFCSTYFTLKGWFASNSRTFHVRKSIIFVSAKYKNLLNDSYCWVIPSGEFTDGASIPRILWSLLGGPFSGAYRLSAAVHDFYCREGQDRDSEISRRIPYSLVHKVFEEMLEAEGVRGWKLWAMAKGVKVGGPRW